MSDVENFIKRRNSKSKRNASAWLTEEEYENIHGLADYYKTNVSALMRAIALAAIAEIEGKVEGSLLPKESAGEGDSNPLTEL